MESSHVQCFGQAGSQLLHQVAGHSDRGLYNHRQGDRRGHWRLDHFAGYHRSQRCNCRIVVDLGGRNVYAQLLVNRLDPLHADDGIETELHERLAGIDVRRFHVKRFGQACRQLLDKLLMVHARLPGCRLDRLGFRLHPRSQRAPYRRRRCKGDILQSRQAHRGTGD